MGWVWLGFGACVVAILVVRDASLPWYAIAAVPFFLGALGYFQSREQTCVFFAAIGQRDLDGGAERITDTGELARVHDQARRVWVRTLVATFGLLAVAILIGALTG